MTRRAAFDETSLKPLNLLARAMPANEDQDKLERERLTGYGENSLACAIFRWRRHGHGQRHQPEAGPAIQALGLDLPIDSARQVRDEANHAGRPAVGGSDA
jgi:hypothetical protein